MQVLGRNLPNIQNAINTGFENVASGITEVATQSGVSALDSAFELFSESRFGAAANVNGLPAVAATAEYSDPVEAFGTLQPDNGSLLPAETTEMMQFLKDPGFRPEQELQKLYGPDPIKSDVLGDIYGASQDAGIRQLNPGSAVSEVFEGAADGAVPGESFSKYNTSVERPVFIDQGSAAIQGPLNPYNQARIPVSKAHTSVEGRGARWNVGHPAPNTKFDAPAARGIIIVGGKTDGTNFGTIDDTIHVLQTDPQPEAQQILQEQIAAVQDMSSTAQQAVNLYQQLNANSLFNGMGIVPPKKLRS